MEPEKKTYFEETKDLAAQYIEDRLMLIKLEVAEKVAKASSSIVKGLIVALLSFFILLIVTFLAGYYLSQLVGSIWGGFGILVIVYVLLIFILKSVHKNYLDKSITDTVIKQFFNKD